MKVLILGSFSDLQTGIYILEAFREFSSIGAGIDIRRIATDMKKEYVKETILKEVDELDFTPDIILILKGLELDHDSIKYIKDRFPKAKLTNWFFDKYLQNKPIWEEVWYHDTLRLYDYYFCSLKGVADNLKAFGFNNVYYLDEACSPDWNGEVYMNQFQEKKYGSDVAFIGSIGYTMHHPTRIPVLEKVSKEGFDLKIWGKMVCEPKLVPKEVKDKMTGAEAINENHSMICQSSKVILGIDQDITIDQGHSARLYRVLCAGGCYVSSPTKGLDKQFKINGKGAKLTGDEDIVVFYNVEDLIEKIDFLLEHEDIRQRIANNGKRKVLELHKFTDRIEEMLKIMNIGEI